MAQVDESLIVTPLRFREESTADVTMLHSNAESSPSTPPITTRRDSLVTPSSSPHVRPKLNKENASSESNGYETTSNHEVAQLTAKLDNALKIAQKSLQIQQACLARERRLQKQLKVERDRVQVLSAERDLLLAQRVEMLASARSLEVHIRRWTMREQEYRAKLAENATTISNLQGAQQQLLVQLDDLSEQVRQLEQRKSAYIIKDAYLSSL